jgi:hypothetical protein
VRPKPALRNIATKCPRSWSDTAQVRVSYTDLDGIEHAVTVEARSFCHAVGIGPAHRDAETVGEWLARPSRTPAETAQRTALHEINVRIGWLWDGGIDVRLGDEVNGFLAEEDVALVTEILPWCKRRSADFRLPSPAPG